MSINKTKEESEVIKLARNIEVKPLKAAEVSFSSTVLNRRRLGSLVVWILDYYLLDACKECNAKETEPRIINRSNLQSLTKRGLQRQARKTYKEVECSRTNGATTSI